MDASVDLLDGGAAVGLLVPPATGAVAADADAAAAVEAVPRHEDHHEHEHQDRHETGAEGIDIQNSNHYTSQQCPQCCTFLTAYRRSVYPMSCC